MRVSSVFSCVLVSDPFLWTLHHQVQICRVAGKTTESKLSAHNAATLAAEICRKHYALLGLSPDSELRAFEMGCVPVLPAPLRPAMVFGTGESLHDLTFLYREIVRANANLAARLNSHYTVTIDSRKTLYGYIAQLFGCTFKGLPVATHRGGRPYKGIPEILEGKQGRFRSNLMGKRVNFSARSVISGSMFVRLHEIGLPLAMCMNLSVGVRVTRLNIDHLRRCVKNGPNKHPGANAVVDAEGREVHLKGHLNEENQVQIGCVVYRHLVNGDFVLVNRQPSLHKHSLMCHEVVVVPHNTIVLNFSATGPYNADFDGDEMTIYVPQSVQAIAEASSLMHVRENIVSAARNRPVMALKQDMTRFVWWLTRRDVFFTKEQMMQIACHLEEYEKDVDLDRFKIDLLRSLPVPAILKPEALWTGKQAFSLVLPEKMAYDGHNVEYAKPDSAAEQLYFEEKASDSTVVIRGGELIRGRLCSKLTGTAPRSLVDCLYINHSPAKAQYFINAVQGGFQHLLELCSFSIGLTDLGMGHDLARVHQSLDEKVAVVEVSNASVVVDEKLSAVMDTIQKDLAKLVSPNSRLREMIVSGAKGSWSDAVNMMVGVGQCRMFGKPMQDYLPGRSLAYFKPGNRKAAARGFVANSYLKGLLPDEYYFNLQANRQMQTIVKADTGKSGYAARRAQAALQDLLIGAIDSVLEGERTIQFAYGEDGMNGMYTRKQSLDGFLSLDQKEFDSKFKYRAGDLKEFDRPRLKLAEDVDLDQDLIREWIKENVAEHKYLDAHRANLSKLVVGLCDQTGESGSVNSAVSVVDFDALIAEAQAASVVESAIKADLPVPLSVIVARTLSAIETGVFPGVDKSVEEEWKRVPKTDSFLALLWCKLAPQRVIHEYKLTRGEFEKLVRRVCELFLKRRAEAGESVGCQAAQFISEVLTQMTLNTKHSAGTGLDRFIDLTYVRDKVSDLRTTVPLLAKTQEEAQKIASGLAELRVQDVCELAIVRDRATDRPSLRILYKRDVMKSRNVSVDFIKSFFEEVHTEWVEKKKGPPVGSRLLYSSDSKTGDGYLTLKGYEKEEDDAALKYLLQLGSFVVRKKRPGGVAGISRCVVQQRTRCVRDEKTSQISETSEWVALCEGTNLKGVFAHTGVDFQRVVTSSVMETYRVLGIEAARRVIVNEFRACNEDLATVDVRHFMTFAERMTWHGYPQPLHAAELSRESTGTLKRAAFERSSKVLQTAALESQVDTLDSIPSQLAVGAKLRFGTGAVDALLDEKALDQYSRDEQFDAEAAYAQVMSQQYTWEPEQPPEYYTPEPAAIFLEEGSFSPAHYSEATSPAREEDSSPQYQPPSSPQTLMAARKAKAKASNPYAAAYPDYKEPAPAPSAADQKENWWQADMHGSSGYYEEPYSPSAPSVASNAYSPSAPAVTASRASSVSELVDLLPAAAGVSASYRPSSALFADDDVEMDPGVQMALERSKTSEQKANEARHKEQHKIYKETGIDALYCHEHGQWLKPTDRCESCVKRRLKSFADELEKKPDK